MVFVVLQENLINKKRLFLVPHATLSIEAKNMQNKHLYPLVLEKQKTYFTLKWALVIIIGVLLIDQCSKFYIKLNFPLSGYGVPPIVDWGFF